MRICEEANRRLHRVIRVSESRFAEAADVIAEAFDGDPLMDWFFADVPEPRRSTIRAQFAYLCTRHAARGWPIWGVEIGRNLAGVGFLVPPSSATQLPPDPSIEEAYGRFRRRITTQAETRLSRYGQWKEALPLPEAHLYVMTVGVRPQFQRRGVGGTLLAKAEAICDGTPGCRGVALDTENERNLKWYRDHGFALVAEGRLDDLRLWSLFKSRTGSPSTE